MKPLTLANILKRLGDVDLDLVGQVEAALEEEAILLMGRDACAGGPEVDVDEATAKRFCKRVAFYLGWSGVGACIPEPFTVIEWPPEGLAWAVAALLKENP